MAKRASRKSRSKKRVGRIRRTRRQISRVPKASGAQRIDAKLKGLTIAAEPPIDSAPANLSPEFLTKVNMALAELQTNNTPFRLVEGFRTRERQQWLFGSGRPTATPFGRPGPILTNADGVTKLSKHQGNGSPGSGTAADCYPTKNGKVFIPPSSDPVWKTYAAAVKKQGLIAGADFTTIKDSPHCELPA